ncbi:hypothetical protein [Shewanella gaetbuli]|uniref:Uncharacterized protein n=1 Tax=Shewanella gaetbuli TaxID=220752 RepID=A0A9X1ZJU6_9GAMM|nr:hypothetical protein [Shewanella gaetbuli]MCL1142841.1 hypothetical protein [Shewanella gaetbuli]
MTVIRSVNEQWHKAEYANQLNIFLSQQTELNSLFVGATSSATVCNLISAMIELPEKPQDNDYKINIEQAFDALFQCFILLFVKEAEHKDLSQAEQLVLSLSVNLANEIQQHSSEHANALVNKAHKTLTAMEQLEKQRKQQRKASKNMGRQ